MKILDMFIQAQKRGAFLRVDLLRKSVLAWLAGLIFMTLSLLKPLPALALAYQHAPRSIPVATMANKVKAAAKDTEGKLESAYGDLSGDKGRQIKGKAKQLQGSAMNAGEDIKEGAKSIAKKVGDAAK